MATSIGSHFLFSGNDCINKNRNNYHANEKTNLPLYNPETIIIVTLSNYLRASQPSFLQSNLYLSFTERFLMFRALYHNHLY